MSLFSYPEMLSQNLVFANFFYEDFSYQALEILPGFSQHVSKQLCIFIVFVNNKFIVLANLKTRKRRVSQWLDLFNPRILLFGRQVQSNSSQLPSHEDLSAVQPETSSVRKHQPGGDRQKQVLWVKSEVEIERKLKPGKSGYSNKIAE
jgi:hypothetical protein